MKLFFFTAFLLKISLGMTTPSIHKCVYVSWLFCKTTKIKIHVVRRCWFVIKHFDRFGILSFISIRLLGESRVALGFVEPWTRERARGEKLLTIYLFFSCRSIFVFRWHFETRGPKICPRPLTNVPFVRP